MTNRRFNIIKHSGNLERFSRKKLYRSLRRSGLPHGQSQLIADKVTAQVREGSRSQDIFENTLRIVNRTSPLAAVHYSLKRALFDLGPTGHHFETYVARYFDELGYETKTCQVLKGRLVKHEVDVIASNGTETVFVECKFHNRQGIKNDVKISLYVKARRDDLKEGPEGARLTRYFIASNTSFSTDAIAYGAGSGLGLLGVNAPEEESFLSAIKAMKLYPVTSLKHLNRTMKAELLASGVVLARELLDRTSLLVKAGMPERDIVRVLDEVRRLGDGQWK